MFSCCKDQFIVLSGYVNCEKYTNSEFVLLFYAMIWNCENVCLSMLLYFGKNNPIKDALQNLASNCIWVFLEFNVFDMIIVKVIVGVAFWERHGMK